MLNARNESITADGLGWKTPGVVEWDGRKGSVVVETDEEREREREE